MGVFAIRKIIIGILVISLFFISVVIYNHKQQPTINDVFEITKNQSPETEEVYLVKKIDGKWLTIFRNQHLVMIGELKQNRIGLWQLRDEMGLESSLTSTYYPPEKEDEITWGATEIEEKEIVYYFGQVINPEIQKLTVETNENPAEDVPLITSNGNRFFFKKVKGKLVSPTNIKGFSKSGELKYSTLPEKPQKVKKFFSTPMKIQILEAYIFINCGAVLILRCMGG